MGSMKLSALPIPACIFFALLLQLGYGQSQTLAPSPAAEPPSSDGTAIDQGIAYILLLVALATTYLVH